MLWDQFRGRIRPQVSAVDAANQHAALYETLLTARQRAARPGPTAAANATGSAPVLPSGVVA